MNHLKENKVRRLLVFPLYPQYCAATTASTFDAVTNVLQKWRWIPELRFINQYFEEKKYIEVLSSSIEDFWKINGFDLIYHFHINPLLLELNVI